MLLSNISQSACDSYAVSLTRMGVWVQAAHNLYSALLSLSPSQDFIATEKRKKNWESGNDIAMAPSYAFLDRFRTFAPNLFLNRVRLRSLKSLVKEKLLSNTKTWRTSFRLGKNIFAVAKYTGVHRMKHLEKIEENNDELYFNKPCLLICSIWILVSLGNQVVHFQFSEEINKRNNYSILKHWFKEISLLHKTA